MTSDLTNDAFLGGKLHLLQPKSGYRAGVDPVLLAATVEAEPGEAILDLGCGVGTAALCLGARVSGLTLTGVELHPAYAALARRNGGASFEVIEADLAHLPLSIRDRQFQHVLANPPYFDRYAGKSSPDSSREVALGEATPLETWVKVAAKRLRPKGQAHFIHRAERLPELLNAMQGRLGSIEVLPLAPRRDRTTERVIVRGRKAGRAAFKLHAPLVMHEGSTHEKDGDSYVASVRAVLREGAALYY